MREESLHGVNAITRAHGAKTGYRHDHQPYIASDPRLLVAVGPTPGRKRKAPPPAKFPVRTACHGGSSANRPLNLYLLAAKRWDR